MYIHMYIHVHMHIHIHMHIHMHIHIQAEIACQSGMEEIVGHRKQGMSQFPPEHPVRANFQEFQHTTKPSNRKTHDQKQTKGP